MSRSLVNQVKYHRDMSNFHFMRSNGTDLENDFATYHKAMEEIASAKLKIKRLEKTAGEYADKIHASKEL